MDNPGNRRRRSRSPRGSRTQARDGSPDPRHRNERGDGPGDRGRTIEELRELSPFSVFCALHLGVTDTDGYARQNHASVARRFELSAGELDAFLRKHSLDHDSLESGGFDGDSARLDIEVAPPGISRTELARTLFEELSERESA